MTDLAVFGEEGFDPRAWINAACAAKAPDEPLERFLAEAEMRLTLGGEELEAALGEASAAALRRVPFAQQEVARLRGEVAALLSSSRGLLGSVSADASAAAAAAAPLAALHTARSNMEAGCATLREAAELSGAFRRVEEVFAAGDLPRVAGMLASMARSLALVGGVPEFAEGRGRLAALEDRLQRRLEGRLADALQANAGPEVASLAGLLLAVGRYNSLEAAYVTSRMPRVTALWDEAAALLNSSSSSTAAATGGHAGGAAGGGGGGGGLGGGWLLLLYNGLMGLLEGDAAWLGGCLPAQRQQLLVALLTAALEKLNKSIRDRLSGLRSTKQLAGLLPDVTVAARRLRELLAATAAPGGDAAGGDGSLALKLLKLLLEPLEQQISRYTALEEPVITAELQAALPLPASTTPAAKPGDAAAAAAAAAAAEDEDVDAEVAQKLDAACSSAFACLGDVVERCLLLSGGSELPQLLLGLDKQLAGYLQRLTAAVGIISGRYSRLSAAGSGAADISGMLQLVVLARHVSNRLNSLETRLRSTLGKTIPRLQQLAAAGLPPLLGSGPQQGTQQLAGPAAAAAGVPAAAAGAAAELLPLRLAAFPAKLAPLRKLQAAAGSSRFMSIPAAIAAGTALCEAISTAVYDALLAPVVACLTPLPGLADWTAAAGGGAGGVLPGQGAVVPSFSAYPLAAVTSVGEYLMGLPQQLEVLLGEDAAAAAAAEGAPAAAGSQEDEGDELAAEWLDKVVRGAGLLYSETLLMIRQLSAAGAAQLAADSEYFCNVMSALAVPPPVALITAQLFGGAAADGWAELASGALAGGSADAKMLKALAQMRGIAWSPEAAAASVAAAAAAEAGPEGHQKTGGGGGCGEDGLL